jgi:Fe-S cluster assembly scaffold protein SufB
LDLKNYCKKVVATKLNALAESGVDMVILNYEFTNSQQLSLKQVDGIINAQLDIGENSAAGNHKLTITPSKNLSKGQAVANIDIRIRQSIQADIQIDIISKDSVADLDLQTQVNIHLEQGARLNLFLNETEVGCKQILKLIATAESEAKLNILAIEYQSPNSSKNILCKLVGRSAAFDYNAIDFGHSNIKHESKIEASHEANATSSTQSFRALSSDAAKLHIDTLVRMNSQATASESHQLAKAILMSPNARVTAKPQLRIETDDVIANHGVAIGPLDEEQLHYMTTRGLSTEDAHQLLITGFINEAIDKIHNPLWKESIHLISSIELKKMAQKK